MAAGNGQSEDVTFTPTDSLDYNTAPLTVTVNVSQATLAVTADGQTKVYGNSDPALTYSASGFQYADNAGSAPAAACRGPPVRRSPATPSARARSPPTPTTRSAIPANLVITPATPSVSSVNAVNLGYGTALANTQLSGTASVPGSFSYTTAAALRWRPATARART